MTSSSAILYPTLKGLESSNSSFVQVSHPGRDNNRNSPSNLRYSASAKAERGNKSKLPRGSEAVRGDLVERNEDLFMNRRQQRDYLNNVDRPVVVDKEIGDHRANRIERLNPFVRLSNVSDLAPKLKVEKSQQYLRTDIREAGISNAENNSSMKNENTKSSTEIAELSLIKPESVQNLIDKHPKHTIIINNTFINRPPTEQDEFLAKFSPNFYKNPNISSSARDDLPSVTEVFQKDCEPLTIGDDGGILKQKEDNLTLPTDIEDSNSVLDNLHDASISDDKCVPLGSIITAVLWLILILFWILLYLKVLNVYNPKVVPKPEPTNYELCLMFIRKLGLLVGQFWKF